MGELFKRRNLVGFILKITGLVIIAWGIITGFMLLAAYNNDYSTDFDYVPVLGVTTFFMPIAVGFLFIGFGELIDLVQKIVDHNHPKTLAVNDEQVEDGIGLAPRTIPFYAEQELKAHYANQNEEIDKITPTNEKDIFKVDVHERIEYVEVGGFSPKILTEQEAERFSQ